MNMSRHLCWTVLALTHMLVCCLASPPAFAEQEPGYTRDLADVSTPERRLEGNVGGQPFILENVQYQKEQKLIRLEGEAGQELLSFMFLDGEAPGQSWQVTKPADDFDLPHVHALYEIEDGTFTDAYMDGYVMKLSLGKPDEGVILGRLYLCLPDERQSWVAGEFDLPYEKDASPEAEQENPPSQWEMISFKPGLPGWTTRQGQWRAIDEKTVEGQSSEDGLLLELDRDLGERFEVRCTVIFVERRYPKNNSAGFI